MTNALILVRDEQEGKRLASYIQDWIKVLNQLDPKLNIRIYPDMGNIDEIDFLLVLTAPKGIFAKFPHVKGIIALSAGIDHILSDTSLIPEVPLIRMLDPYMANDMCQYAITYVMHYVRRVEFWQKMQQQHLWGKEPPFDFSTKTIGVMGLGYLGKKVSVTLNQLGFSVNGWSHSPKKFRK